jgi:predicted ATPase
MLEPVRQYALELFVEGGEEEMVRRAHAEYFLALAEEAEPELLGPDQGRWLVRLRTESENLRGALSWSLEPDQEGGWAQELRLRLVAALCRFWDVEGFQESRRWLQAALERLRRVCRRPGESARRARLDPGRATGFRTGH